MNTDKQQGIPLDPVSLLQAHGQEITSTWAERNLASVGPRCPGLTLQELDDMAAHALAAVVESLTAGSREGLEPCLADVSLRAVRAGYRAADVMSSPRPPVRARPAGERRNACAS